MQLFTNNADSKLAGNITAAAGSMTLQAGDGAKFPAPSNGDYFLLTLFQKAGTDEINHEIVRITARAGDVLTIGARGLEGTTARAFNTADPVSLRLTAGAVLPINGGTLTDALNEAATVTMPSAASMQVGTAKANTVNVTGTTTINAFDAAPAGATRRMNFAGALTLTHSVAALSVLGGASIVTAPGDWCEWISTGGGKWSMISYTRASGDSLGVVSIEKGGTGASTAAGARTAIGAAPSDSPSFSSSVEVVHASGEVQSSLKSGGKYARLAFRSSDENFTITASDGVSVTTRIRIVGPAGYVAIAESGGNVLLGTSVDDGTARLQVNGAAKATSFIGPLTGNAATATKLATARAINGQAFDGTKDITIADATKVPLTGGIMSGPLTVPGPLEVAEVNLSSATNGSGSLVGIRVPTKMDGSDPQVVQFGAVHMANPAGGAAAITIQKNGGTQENFLFSAGGQISHSSGNVFATTAYADGKVADYASKRDASGGHAGLTGYDVNIKNAAGTVVSRLSSIATAVRTYTMPDKSGTVAMLSDLVNTGPTPITSNAVGLGAGDYLFTGNYSITLADLTTLNGARPVLTCPSNLQTPPTTIKTSDGWTISTGFTSGETSSLIPIRADTPHGWWGASAMTPALLSQRANPIGAIPTLQSSVKLSETCIIFALIPGGGDTVMNHHLFAVNPQTGVITYLRAVAAIGGAASQYAQPNSLFAIGPTSYAYTYCNGSVVVTDYDDVGDPIYSTVPNAVVLSGQVNAGSNTDAGAGVTTARSGVSWATVPAQLTATTFVGVLYSDPQPADPNKTNVVGFSVNGTSVTLGTVFGKFGLYQSNRMAIQPVTATTAVIFGTQHQSSSATPFAQVVTVSNNNVTMATVQIPSSPVYNIYGVGYSGALGLLKLAENKFLGFGSSPTLNGTALVTFTVNGTVITFSPMGIAQDFRLGQMPYNVNHSAKSGGLPSNCAARLVNQYTDTYVSLLDWVNSSSATRQYVSIVAPDLPTTPYSTNRQSTNFESVVKAFTGDWSYALVQGATKGFQKVNAVGTSFSAFVATNRTPSAVFSDTLTDAAVNYGGVWYTYAVPSADLPIAVDKYVNINSSFITCYGNFS